MSFTEKMLLPAIGGLLVVLAVVLHASLQSTVELTRTTTYASGARTEQDGQVYVTSKEDGTMYLSTQSIDSTASASQYSNNSTSAMSVLGTPIQVPEGFAETLAQLINALLTFVMVISALLVLFFLVWGALQWITSGGDKGKVDQARQKIIAAVIGIIIVSSTYAIFLLVINFLGFEDTEDLFNNMRTIQGVQLQQNETATESAVATDAAYRSLEAEE